MIVQLTWHGEPIGTLEVQFVWPPPLDRGALLPLLSASSGSAAVSVVFAFAGTLDALELDLARPLVLRGALGGPTEVGAFHGKVEARFDEIDVHGFVASPLGSRGGKGPSVSLQRQVAEARWSVSGSGLSGHVDISTHGELLTFAAAVEGSRSELRAYPQGGGVIEVHSERRELIASLNWRWPRSFDAESPWAVALRALLEFVAERPSATLLLGFELAPEEALPSPSWRTDSGLPRRDEQWDRGRPVAAARSSEPSVAGSRRAPAARILGPSSNVLLGGVAVALVAFIAALLLWQPSGAGNDSAGLLPAGTVSSRALQPLPRSAADRDAGRKQ